MHRHLAAAALIPGLIACAGQSAAQDRFAYPSCISATLSSSAAQLSRFIPPEAQGAPAMQLRGIVVRTVTWKVGETIKVCFKSGTRAAQERVARYAREWTQYANVVFDFEENGSPRQCRPNGGEDIKIDFIDRAGWWSVAGTISRQRDPSMNLQFFGVDTPLYANGKPAPESELRKIILHEFGHALGMLHEHQSPAANCDDEINWEAAYLMGARMGWDKAQTDRNFRQFMQSSEFNVTEVDRKSIMHYSLPPEIFKTGTKSACWVPDNTDLSELDRKFIARIYPKTDTPLVVSSAPPTNATRSIAPPSGQGREALIKQYEELLQKSGVAAARIRQLSAEFSKALPK